MHSYSIKGEGRPFPVTSGVITQSASYVLAFRDQQTASDVTTTIFTACIGYLVSYAAKSATEKISRNRHGLDADGNPISGAGVGEYTTTTTSDKEAKG